MSDESKTAIEKFGMLRLEPVRPNGRNLVQGRERLFTVSLLVLVPLLIAAVLIASYGDFVACLAVISALAVVAITFYRVDWGFYIFLAVVLVLDQYRIPGVERFTGKCAYVLNLAQSMSTDC